MAESKPRSATAASTTRSSSSLLHGLLLLVVTPVAIAVLLYRLDDFDPAPLPIQRLPSMVVPKLNGRMLQGSEILGHGLLPGPEDLAYDAESGVIYTGCADGWIKRVKVTESAADATVENWVHVGGRPLGLVLGLDNQLLVADAEKGLLKVTKEGVVDLLTDEAEGLKFRITDGLDVANDGIIYFTDASYKYSLAEHTRDILEGRPHGRLMSFDPSINQTEVLVRDLYFANGVAVAPDQSFVVFCETVMRRCRRYYIQGQRKGTVENFIDNLPGLPDNIRYDGEGHYWIALVTAVTPYWDVASRYPFVRKGLGILDKYVGRPHVERDGGVLAVDLEGKPVAHYYDPALSMLTTGIKIGKHLYCGSVLKPYIMRLNLAQYPALTP
ncbi:hypothetical protein HHK36_031100 [Tetracentron sinense]|uniref:Strictosidine synthase conserved region domain-containing protein n=1 Tax=Tetracentron sinense TaxID=13715 RepID=A0A834YDB7_TETSI|nr:hypothetical protein HHK36_031100 [Tetracentron sinense]